MNCGLKFSPSNTMNLDCYVDADFAGLYSVEDVQDPVCVKSRTGFCLMLGGCPLLWVSKLQMEIALSTMEAEYIMLSQSMCDLLPMQWLLAKVAKALSLSLGSEAKVMSTMFKDNNGALSLATSPKMNLRIKHIAVKYHHFCSQVGEGTGINIEKIETENQKADIFSKGFSVKHFARLLSINGVVAHTI